MWKCPPRIFFDFEIFWNTFLQADPYVMVNEDTTLKGNDRFHGFCIDLLKTVADQLTFNYVIELVPDRKYGALDPNTGEWNGMVRELLQKVSLDGKKLN